MFCDTFEMVRLYPIPFRYLESPQAFKSWQMIEAEVQRDESDPRPESYKIKFRTIVVGEKVTNHDERRAYLERSPHFCKSVSDLKRLCYEASSSDCHRGVLLAALKRGSPQIVVKHL